MSRSLEALVFLEVYPSQANFLLARLKPGLQPGPGGRDAREVQDGLAQRGIFVRYFDSPRLRDCLRISVGRPEDTERLVEALQSIGGERGR